jgi:uncharacterized membrane protein
MNIAQTIPLADTWGMHGSDIGWGWMMIPMVLFWGAIILGVAWFIKGSARGWSTPAETPVSLETPVEILERRFAEGAISPDDYRARREVLVNGTAEANDAHEEVPLAAPR